MLVMVGLIVLVIIAVSLSVLASSFFGTEQEISEHLLFNDARESRYIIEDVRGRTATQISKDDADWLMQEASKVRDRLSESASTFMPDEVLIAEWINQVKKDGEEIVRNGEFRKYVEKKLKKGSDEK